MNKLSVVAGAILVVSFVSCKEKGPTINFGGGKAEDTTYMAAVETPQDRVVLLEEFTGCSCPPCPAGHLLIYGPGGIKEQHPEHVAVIAYHIKNFPQAYPIHGAKYDFRTDDATNVGATVYNGIGTLPLGGVDRVNKNGVLTLEKSNWAGQVNTEAGIKPNMNISIVSTYNDATRAASVSVKVAYTQPVSKKQNLTLAIIENNIIDGQKNGLDEDTAYVHKSVLRDIITQYYGEAVVDSFATKTAGRVYERKFSFNVSSDWNAENCELVAFITNNEGDDKSVQQAAEIKLK